MTVLVAYATHSGATRTLADTIVEELARHGVGGEAVDVREDPDPRVHDAVVIGSSVRMESVEKPLVAWEAKHHQALGAMPVAVFTCSGSAADPKKAGQQKAADAFVADTGLRPVGTRNFPGWVILEKIPAHERVLMKAMRTPLGDFRDLEAVAAWTRDILPQLEG